MFVVYCMYMYMYMYIHVLHVSMCGCCRMQQWRYSFVDLGLIWMEVLGKQLNRWVLSSIARDKVRDTHTYTPAVPVYTCTCI